MSLSEQFSWISPSLPETITRQQYPAGTLYVVATPIGNTGDISLRALYLLNLADAIACEDTRNTAQLLSLYGLQKPLIAAHQHNEREVAQKIAERLQAGERIALVSDAGTPGVSDPGARIVDELRNQGLPVIALPGASAAITALSASGFTDDQFQFVGFLPSKAGQRKEVLQRCVNTSATQIFYEAPHRIHDTIAAMLEVFGPQRRIVLARELTKLFEESQRCTLAEAGAWLKADKHREKGEYVLLIEGLPPQQDNGMQEAQRILGILLESCSVSQAASLAAAITGQKKNALYQLALSMQTEDDEAAD